MAERTHILCGRGSSITIGNTDLIFGMPIHSSLFLIIAALLLGVVCGMRTFVAPAILALTLSRSPELVAPVAPVHWFTHSVVAIILAIAAIGELIGDKLPQTPNRTALAPFVARAVSGGICGAAIFQLGSMNPWIGAGCGAVAAATSTIGTFHARRYVGRVTGIRDRYIAVAEDLIAIMIATSVIATMLV